MRKGSAWEEESDPQPGPSVIQAWDQFGLALQSLPEQRTWLGKKPTRLREAWVPLDIPMGSENFFRGEGGGRARLS